MEAVSFQVDLPDDVAVEALQGPLVNLFDLLALNVVGLSFADLFVLRMMQNLALANPPHYPTSHHHFVSTSWFMYSTIDKDDKSIQQLGQLPLLIYPREWFRNAGFVCRQVIDWCVHSVWWRSKQVSCVVFSIFCPLPSWFSKTSRLDQIRAFSTKLAHDW